MSTWAIELILIDMLLGGAAVWLLTNARFKRNFRLLRLTAKHASCHGFTVVKDARAPEHVILRCPGHDLTHRSNPNWQPFDAQQL